MKKLLAIVLSVVMVFALFGAVLVLADNPTTYNVLDVKSQIRTIGRTEEVSNGIACDWTASGLEFNAICSGDIAVKTTSTCVDQGSLGTYNKDCYFTVYIDDVRQDYRVRTMDGTFTFNIAEGLSQGTHKIKIVKETERNNALVTFNSIIFDGTFGEKPANQPYVFEFIGDSITCGHSAVSTGGDSMAARKSSGTRTYAYLTAENFNAEARITSISGGSMTSLYTAYNKLNRTDDDYDFSLAKPNGVGISLGTNDGERTVDYWQNNIKKFADAIRGGYDDDNIPIVMIVNVMDNGDNLRKNIANAIKNLYDTDSSKYDKIFITSANGFTGGHPRQNIHEKASRILTRDFVEFGIVPINALKADATVTLTENSPTYATINSMNSVVSVGGSYSSAISGTIVDPLDPADEGNASAHAVKYTADGTQSATLSNNNTQVKFGTAYNENYKSKGISFYINYKDTTDYTGVESPTYSNPKIVISYADKYVKIPITVEQGVTQKVEFNWINCQSTLNYFYKQTYQNAGSFNVSLELTGECECTIDNIRNELNTYSVSSNSNRAYTYSMDCNYEVIGVTENYEPTTSTTTTTEPVPGSSYTFKFDPNNCDFTYTSSGMSVVQYDDTVNSIKYLRANDVTVGGKLTFTTKQDIAAGDYKVQILSRTLTSGRAVFTATIGENSTTLNTNTDYEVAKVIDLFDSVTVDEAGKLVLDLTATSTGNLFLYQLRLTPVGSAPSQTVFNYEAEDVYSTASATYSGGLITGSADDTSVGTQTYVQHAGSNASPAVGQYFTLNLTGLTTGEYKVEFLSRCTDGRSAYTVAGYDSTNVSQALGTVKFYEGQSKYLVSGNTYYCRLPVPTNAVVSTGSTLKLVLTLSELKSMGTWIDKVVLTRVGDYDGEELTEPSTTEPSSTEPTEPSTEPTTVPSGPTTERTVVYTMDPGSRMRSAAAPWAGDDATYGPVKYMQVGDNYVLRMKSRGDTAFYIQLPSDWYTAAGEGFTPVSISYKFARGADLASFTYHDAHFCTATATGGSAGGTMYKFNSSLVSVGSEFTEETIDLSQVTSGTLSDYSYLVFKSKSATGAADTAGLYIDDVKITYEGSAPVESPVSTDDRTSIRLNNPTGIRFFTTIDTDAVAALNTNNEEVEYGTLIGPADRIGEELDMDDITAGNAVVVKYTSSAWYSDNTFVGSIVNVKAKNIARSFVGRGYVKIGDTYYYSEGSATRSLAQVAYNYKNDANSGYSLLENSLKSQVDAWAEQYS